MSQKNKICLIHDMFLYRGGAERFNIMLARSLGADLSALFFSADGLKPESLGFTGKCISFGKNIYSGGLRQIYLKWRVLFHTQFLREYDTVIFSNDSLSAIRNVRKDARKIYYAHSIPRYLFDQREFYYQKVPLFLRPVYVLIRAVFERIYRKELAQVDEIYVNSSNLQMAMRQYLGRESQIIHPPVDMDYFVPSPLPDPLLKGEGTKKDNKTPRLLLGKGVGGRGGIGEEGSGEVKETERLVSNKDSYYISFSKLSTLKRVARTVEAFREMPEKQLLVIYGENDPQKDEIIAMADGCENIIFLTLEDNNELPRYIAGAIATIFIAKNEDFGMVALESMSCGIPVIGVDEWGIRETVIDGKTGILISPEATKEELIQAVQKLDPETALAMRYDSIERAREFSLKNFEKIVQEKFL